MKRLASFGLFVIAYALLVVALMWFNTTILGITDRLLAGDSWWVYSLAWGLAFLPSCLLAIVALATTRSTTSLSRRLLGIYLFMLAFVIEVCFLLDFLLADRWSSHRTAWYAWTGIELLLIIVFFRSSTVLARRASIERTKASALPAVHGPKDTARPSIVRIALCGVCFFGAIFLMLVVVGVSMQITIWVSLGPHSVIPLRDQLSDLLLTLWACVNIISFGFVGVGVLRQRLRLTVIGGTMLFLTSSITGIILSTVIHRGTP